ncbi:MAG TPA: DUF6174 domain-containing protein [Gemmatimonadaceae bacterium]
MRIPPRHLHLTALCAAALLAVGCSSPTSDNRPDDHPNGRSVGTTPSEVTAEREQWASHGVKSYEYDYTIGGGFFIVYADHPIHVVVRDGVVAAAADVETGEPLPGPLTFWPTIDTLYARAARAAEAGTLLGLRVDSALGYPTEIDLAGPPDASGSLFASNLRALP